LRIDGRTVAPGYEPEKTSIRLTVPPQTEGIEMKLLNLWKREAERKNAPEPVATRTSSGSAPRTATGPATPVRRRVLVVEDDDSLRDLVSRNLAARGHDVRQAADAGEALAALRQETPDVLVLDINLPDATGWDILRTAQLSESTAVVML